MNTQRWPTTPRILRITRTTKRCFPDATFKEYFDSISSLSWIFQFFLGLEIWRNLFQRPSLYARVFMRYSQHCRIPAILHEYFCYSSHANVPLPLLILVSFLFFFFFFGTIARTEKILVRRLLFTIIKKNCETMEIERNWICKRLIREIIIKREVSESFETFDRDESDSLHEGIKKKNLQYVSSFKYFPTLRRRL